MRMHQKMIRSSSSISGSISSIQSISRILREYREISKEPSSFWCAYPILLDEPFEWHFTIKGPSGTEFEGGIYHGCILLPQTYPLAPPSIMLLTQNGRFEIGKKVCLSASNYHPELWQSAWGIRTILDALHAFFPSPSEGAIHSLDWSPVIRRNLASQSVSWTCNQCKKTNQELVDEKCSNSTTNSNTESNPIIQEINKNIQSIKSQTSQNNSLENGKVFILKDVNGDKVSQGEVSPHSQDEEITYTSDGKVIPKRRLPPKNVNNTVAWNFLLLKKPKTILEGIIVILDIIVVLLLLVIFYYIFEFIIFKQIYFSSN